MDEDKIIEVLNSVFRKVFKDESIQVNAQMTAEDVAEWDSLTHMEMVSETEKVFKVRFKLKELVKMKNVGDFIIKIKEKTA